MSTGYGSSTVEGVLVLCRLILTITNIFAQ